MQELLHEVYQAASGVMYAVLYGSIFQKEAIYNEHKNNASSSAPMEEDIEIKRIYFEFQIIQSFRTPNTQLDVQINIQSYTEVD